MTMIRRELTKVPATIFKSLALEIVPKIQVACWSSNCQTNDHLTILLADLVVEVLFAAIFVKIQTIIIFHPA